MTSIQKGGEEVLKYPTCLQALLCLNNRSIDLGMQKITHANIFYLPHTACVKQCTLVQFKHRIRMKTQFKQQIK